MKIKPKIQNIADLVSASGVSLIALSLAALFAFFMTGQSFPGNRAVSVNTNNVVVAPPHFWASNASAVTVYATNVIGGGGGGGETRSVAILTHTEASGVNGGAAVATTWTTRPLNTTFSDPDTIVTSLTSNQFTLPAGTYEIRCNCVYAQLGSALSRLQNITDTTTLALSTAAFSQNNVSFSISVSTDMETGVFTIAAPKTFALQYWASSPTSPLSGDFNLGIGASASVVNTFATVKITKISN